MFAVERKGKIEGEGDSRRRDRTVPRRPPLSFVQFSFPCFSERPERR